MSLPNWRVWLELSASGWDPPEASESGMYEVTWTDKHNYVRTTCGDTLRDAACEAMRQQAARDFGGTYL